MTYKIRDFYSSEAVRQIETMNAIQGQADLRYNKYVPKEVRIPYSLSEWQKGYQEAYYSLTHTLGEMAACLYMDEAKKNRENK